MGVWGAWNFIGALGRNILKLELDFYSDLYVYIYVFTLCVFVCSLDTGRELGVQ